MSKGRGRACVDDGGVDGDCGGADGDYVGIIQNRIIITQGFNFYYSSVDKIVFEYLLPYPIIDWKIQAQKQSYAHISSLQFLCFDSSFRCTNSKGDDVSCSNQ